MPTTNFPNGQTLTSSALTANQMQTLFQQIVAQMLGYNAGPFNITATLTTGSATATVPSTQALYSGMQLVGSGIPTTAPVFISSVVNGTTITLSANAIATGANVLTVTDPYIYSKVRLDWQTFSQPAFGVKDNICFLEAVQIDDNYGLIRDLETVSTTATWTYTRVWRVSFILYGPNSFDNARLLKSASLLDFCHNFLALSNVYLVPDTGSPKRLPEKFNSIWFERTDMHMRFNEFVTETITVGTGISVEVIAETKNGIVADFTIEA